MAGLSPWGHLHLKRPQGRQRRRSTPSGTDAPRWTRGCGRQRGGHAPRRGREEAPPAPSSAQTELPASVFSEGERRGSGWCGSVYLGFRRLGGSGTAAVPGMRVAFTLGTGCLPGFALEQRGEQKERGKNRQDIKTPQPHQTLQNKDKKKKGKKITDTPRPFSLALCDPTRFNYFWEAGAGEGEVLCLGC